MMSSYELVKQTKQTVIGTDSSWSGFLDYDYLTDDVDNLSRYYTKPAYMIYNDTNMLSVGRGTPKGEYITDRIIREAYRGKLKYTEPTANEFPISDTLSKRLHNINKLYQIKQKHIEAVILARQVERSAVVKLPTSFYGTPSARYETPMYLKTVPVPREAIKYKYVDGKQTEAIDYYLLNLPMGNANYSLQFAPHNVKLYVNRPDPFTNGDHGIPELFSLYWVLTWEANRNEGWSKALMNRGLSMLHMSIEDFDIEDLDLYREKYGSIQKYNILFTNEQCKVANLPGAMANYDVANDSETVASQCASATGIGAKRITGENNDITTDSSDSTDNHGAYLSQIHETWENNLIGLFTMLFPDLKRKFAIAYDDKGKDDVLKRANIEANIANAQQVAMNIRPYNDVLAMAGEPPVEGGEVLGEIWRYKQFEKHGMIENEQNLSTQSNSNPNTSNKYDDKGRKRPNPETSKDGNSTRNTQRKATKDLSENRGGVRDRTDTDSKEISVRQEKINYIKEHCNYHDSYKKINSELRRIFKSGISTNDITDIKETYLKPKRDDLND